MTDDVCALESIVPLYHLKYLKSMFHVSFNTLVQTFYRGPTFTSYQYVDEKTEYKVKQNH